MLSYFRFPQSASERQLNSSISPLCLFWPSVYYDKMPPHLSSPPRLYVHVCVWGCICEWVFTCMLNIGEYVCVCAHVFVVQKSPSIAVNLVL